MTSMTEPERPIEARDTQRLALLAFKSAEQRRESAEAETARWQMEAKEQLKKQTDSERRSTEEQHAKCQDFATKVERALESVKLSCPLTLASNPDLTHQKHVDATSTLDDYVNAAREGHDKVIKLLEQLANFRRDRPSRIAVAAIAVLILGAILFVLANSHFADRPTSVNAPSVPGNAIPSDVMTTLNRWRDTMISGDVNGQTDCYAPVVQVFFRRKNVPREVLRRMKRSGMASYPTVKAYQLTNIHLESLTQNWAALTFDKYWDVYGRNHFSGSERQRLTMAKIDGLWKIIEEEELQVYWTKRG